MQQHLGGALCLPERAGYLTIVHAQCEAHDQRFPTIVRQAGNFLENLGKLGADLDQFFRVMAGRDLARRLKWCLRLARPVAIEIDRKVLSDPDEPRAQWPTVSLLDRLGEVAVCLHKDLLGEIFGVMMIAEAVVRKRVDIAQVLGVSLFETTIEFRLAEPVAVLASAWRELLFAWRECVFVAWRKSVVRTRLLVFRHIVSVPLPKRAATP